MASINTANKKSWQMFGMATRDSNPGVPGSIEFVACTNTTNANRRPSMNMPRWLRSPTPKAMTKPEAAEWLLKNPPALKVFIEDMGKADGYTEEQVLKCLRDVSAKNASTVEQIDWDALLNSNAAEG